MLLIEHFKEQHYSVLFNPSSGFFVRVEDQGYPEPFWSQHGPELMDISITNWCDKGCRLCYRKSNAAGQHMTLENYERVLKQAQQMHVLQVALGGGNPNQHPDFCNMLRITRKKYGIVPNYTTNGRGLTPSVLSATQEYCGAVAVSAYSPYEELRKAIEKLTSYGIKTNIHFILSSESIDVAISWFENPPDFFSNINALIFLNYKPVGRCSNRKLLLKNSDRVEEFFQAAVGKHAFRIGFDSCSVSGIVSYTDIPSLGYEACDAARFSMFISEDMCMYPCSFMVEAGYQGIPISENNMLTTWQSDELFEITRAKLSSSECNGCPKIDSCLGGCPLFSEINLCPHCD